MPTQGFSGHQVCGNHPELPAGWVCGKCGKTFCNRCIRIKEAGTVRVELCPRCGNPCYSLSPDPSAQRNKLPARSFLRLVPGIWLYPLRGQGKYLLLAYFIVLGLLGLLSFMPFLGIGAVVIELFLGFYIVAFMIRIIADSANGEVELPDWPELSDWREDLLHPCLLWAAAGMISFGPAILYDILYPASKTLYPPLSLIFWILGELYFPMGLLAVVLCDSPAGLNPLRVIPAIIRTWRTYFVACLILGLIFFLSGIVSKIPQVGPLMAWFLGFYLSLVEMRIIGLIYYTNSKRLKWFET